MKGVLLAMDNLHAYIDRKYVLYKQRRYNIKYYQ